MTLVHISWRMVLGVNVDRADLPFLSVAELSRVIERREVSPVEVVETYLERIDGLDFKFNSYLTVCRKEALESARAAEGAIAQGNYIGPMHGIPVAVKDQLRTQGIRTSYGSRILTDFVPDEDDTAIANLKKAGAIILGKTNLTEFGITGFTHRFSTPRNPWNLDLYTGGSSSGSGAATAAYLCATSLGEDTGGSIRWPAAWCGLVGLRPGWGRVSRYGIRGSIWSMDAVGPISRTVEDAAITLGAIAGYDPKDSYTWKTPAPDYRRALNDGVKGMCIGVIKEEINSEVVDVEVREAVVKATSVLEGLGAVVEEVSLPLTKDANVIAFPLEVDSAFNHQHWLRNRLADYGHDTRVEQLAGLMMPAQTYYKAQRLRSFLRQQVLDALERCDVLVLPTMGKPAQVIEDDPIITSRETVSRLPYLQTQTFALASIPSLSVPCGFSSQGTPIGLQIGGRVGEEDTVLKVAYAYEQSTPWHTMRPPTA